MPGPPVLNRNGLSLAEKRLVQDESNPDAVRLKASELLGRSQTDFVEVRVAPIVTDPHASVESLTARLHAIIAGIKARQLLNAAPSKQPAAATSR